MTNTTATATSSMSLAAAIAAGTSLYGFGVESADGAPVRFDTDADIRATLQYAFPDIGPDVQGTSIDITKSFEDQAAFNPNDAGLLQLRLARYFGAGSFSLQSYYAAQTNQPGDLGLTNFAINAGDTVDGSLTFGSDPFNAVLLDEVSSSDGGPNQFESVFDAGGSMGYLGVQFVIEGATHYGWLGFELEPRSGAGPDAFRARLKAWGYETEAGVAIAAGVPGPASLGVLAIGAAGALGRRKR